MILFQFLQKFYCRNSYHRAVTNSFIVPQPLPWNSIAPCYNEPLYRHEMRSKWSAALIGLDIGIPEADKLFKCPMTRRIERLQIYIFTKHAFAKNYSVLELFLTTSNPW